ncbi:general secretion pathway protein GspB [Paraglaciecola aquimarina]|uniref:General secretion pathway protein GspB n=1 Tax=Paraglaciecola aquimarina TaxID=1235557 RepID=A0ABU3T1G4_9ALTE|nr:general secretion pathway protein GspB [Paraglaciecola aquimarina]MDU0356048.1 general secretion pathway protein GspB [Paraglaciecola aquimarina]
MANSDMSNIITTKELQSGMVIVRVVKQNGPVKIKKSGLVSSHKMVQGLLEMGIQQVEIDPEQTVEIESAAPPVMTKSTTRKMLESNAVTNTRIDDSLSDQFHRSLFLPSVQDIPSAWQYYAKRYLQIVIVFLIGFGLGFSTYNYQRVLTFFSAQLAQPSDSYQTPPEDTANQPVAAKDRLDEKTQPPSAEVVEPLKGSKLDESAMEKIENVAPAVTVERPPTEVVKADLKPTTPVVEQAPPQISAELLNKFNQAIAQVADEPVASDRQQHPSKGDVPRIDQLPAWVMTTLPSMSFSAHMYASEPEQRWVRVNGTKMVEGDVIAQKVKIVRIEPQYVVLETSGQEFSMAALTDW